MKTFLSIVAFTLIFLNISAQDRSQNIWCFGDTAELDFNSGTPVSVGGSKMSTNEGCASIADKNTGQLLFYTDGTHVWDNTNHIMPSDTIALGGNTNSSQSALIVPFPGSNTKYYIFTADDLAGYGNDGNGGVSYTIIDMSLNGGLGDVAQQPHALISPTCEKLAATAMADGTGYWLVTHLYNSTAFYAFPITPLGIGNAVISYQGTNIGGTGGSQAQGIMKISPDGSKIALTHFSSISLVEAFNFSNSTGVVSGQLLADGPFAVCSFGCTSGSPYGLSFSPNSKLLYISLINFKAIYQYDLTAGNLAAVSASKNTVGQTDAPYAMQLGPDEKIYIANEYGVDHYKYLDRINYPDIYGSGCNFQPQAVAIDSGAAVLGLPDFVTRLSSPLLYLSYHNCSGNATAIFADTTLSDTATYLWNFDDPASGNADTSSLSQPIHIFSASGHYHVTVQITNGEDTFSVTKNISVHNPAPTLIVDDSLITCNDNNIQLSASSPDAVSYLWSPSAGLSCVTCPNPQVAPSTSTAYNVQITDSFGCTAHDSVRITVIPFSSVVLTTSESHLCGADSAHICVQSIYDSYLWNTGATSKCIYTATPGDYYATASLAGCNHVSNHVPITASALPQIQISHDSTICNGDTVHLLTSSTSNPLQYSWLPLAGLSCYDCAQPYASPNGTVKYYAQFSDSLGCTGTDSVTITVLPFITATLAADKNYLCFDDSAHICVTSTHAFYHWNNGDNTQCTFANTGGNYYATVTDANNCSGVTNSLTITAYPTQEPVIEIHGDTLIAVVDATIYQWFVNGTPILNSHANTIIADQSGTYIVVVIDNNGCPEISTPTPVTITGLDILNGSEWVKVYPNPITNGSWELTVSEGLIGNRAELYDDNGRLVYKTDIKRTRSEIQLQLPAGIYWLRINSGATVIVEKLVRL